MSSRGKSLTGNASEHNSKTKKIKYKINKKRSQSVDHSAKADSILALQEQALKGHQIEPSNWKKKDGKQKRHTLGPAGAADQSGLFPSLTLSCPNLARVDEKDEEKGGEDEQKEEKKSPILNMTEEQISAFRDIFDMFDSNGGGTIQAEDLDQALQSVDIKLTKEEVNELFDGMDVDGNGEIDFDEFIQLVANTEKFLESIVARNHETEEHHHNEPKPKDKILFEALAHFMKKSALASVNEIVRYYHINAQRYSNPHDVIGHYTAGARLIGLTQRQMRRDMKKLTKISSDSTSPYAQPLVTSLDTFFEEQTHTKKLQFKQRKAREQPGLIPEMTDRHARGKIRLKFMTCVETKRRNSRRDSLYLQFLSMQKHISKQKSLRRGTMLKEIRTLGFKYQNPNLLATIKEGGSNGKRQNSKEKGKKLEQDLTFDDLKLIRKQVTSITTNFYKRVQREKLMAADKHYQEMRIEEVNSLNLQGSFQKAFLAYTDYKHLPISSIASSYSKSNPLFVRL